MGMELSMGGFHDHCREVKGHPGRVRRWWNNVCCVPRHACCQGVLLHLALWICEGGIVDGGGQILYSSI